MEESGGFQGLRRRFEASVQINCKVRHVRPGVVRGRIRKKYARKGSKHRRCKG
jgi:hypothetical protein